MFDALEALREQFEAQNFGDPSYDMWQWLTESDPITLEGLARAMEAHISHLESVCTCPHCPYGD